MPVPYSLGPFLSSFSHGGQFLDTVTTFSRRLFPELQELCILMKAMPSVRVGVSILREIILQHELIISQWVLEYWSSVSCVCIPLTNIPFTEFSLLKVLITQSYLTLCDPLDCSPPGSSVQGILQTRIPGVSCHSLLQGIFPSQGSNLGLLHCRQILYHLSYYTNRDNTIPDTDFSSLFVSKGNLYKCLLTKATILLCWHYALVH